jgi:uncharacterized protein (DUF3820 family)
LTEIIFNRLNTELTDESPMPFGKYKGYKLSTVPVEHLLQLHEDITRTAPNKRMLMEKYLLKYIESNMNEIKSRS